METGLVLSVLTLHGYKYLRGYVQRHMESGEDRRLRVAEAMRSMRSPPAPSPLGVWALPLPHGCLH